MYFRYPNASDEFRVCNTVRIAWWKSDEIREPYTYHHAVTGAEVECSVQVVKISVRKTIPWLGEPLYG